MHSLLLIFLSLNGTFLFLFYAVFIFFRLCNSDVSDTVFVYLTNYLVKFFVIIDKLNHLLFHQYKDLVLHFGCTSINSYSSGAPYSGSNFVKQLVDSKPLFLLFSFYLLVCFKFVMFVSIMHF